MKKIKISILFITLILVLSACSSKKKVENLQLQTTHEVLQEQSEEHILSELMENVLVDAKIETPFQETCEICKAVPNAYTSEFMTDVFLKEDNSDILVTPLDSDGFTIETEKGSYIYCEAGRIFFNAPRYDVNKDIADVMWRYSQNEQGENSIELSFMSREEVLSQASSLLDKLNVLGQPEIRAFVAMRQDEITAYQEELMHDSNYADYVEIGKTTLLDNLTELDNAYYLRLSFKYNDLPIIDEEYEQHVKFAGNAFSPSSVTAEILITSRGIQFFSIRGSFSDNTSSSESTPILNVNEILNFIEDKYDLVMITEPVTFTKIYLEYLPVQSTPSANVGTEVMLTPYWCLEYGYTQEDGTFRMAGAERFNAVTGKDYAYGE